MVASRTHVILLGGGTTDVPHEKWFAIGPARPWYRLRAEERASIARQGARLLTNSAVAAWH